MTPRRKETSFPPEQSVHFYKIIALTFLLFAVAVLLFVGLLSSKQATITITTASEPIEINAVVAVNESGSGGAWAGIVTSTAVSYRGGHSPTHGEEQDSIATGTAVLHNDTGVAQTLIPKTRLQIPDGVLFRMRTRSTVPANGTATVEVYADQPGKSGNIGPSRFVIPGLPADKQPFIYATSDASMVGGTKTAGVFTAADKERIEAETREYLLDLAKERFAPSGGGMAAMYMLDNLQISFGAAVGSSTDSIAAEGVADAVAVFYPPDAARRLVESELKKQAVDDAEIVLPSPDEPSVVIESVDLRARSAELKISGGGFASLNPDSREIEKSFFFGKSRDDVRRYVLSLNHVYGVDVDFFPAWTFTVPAVADHVTVVVKRVE